MVREEKKGKGKEMRRKSESLLQVRKDGKINK